MRTCAATDASSVVFEARGISKVYRAGESEVHALRGVDLDLAQGELVVLLGPSGSGKSTLLNILGGLDVPTSGSVRFRDHDLSTWDEAELTRYRREHVGFVFQFYNLIASLTALESLEHGHARRQVEGTSRLIAEQQIRVLGDRPRDGHSLLFAA